MPRSRGGRDYSDTAGTNKDGIPLTQLYSGDIDAEYERSKAKGVGFHESPKPIGPTKFRDFDDTCGNFIRLVEG